jgi:hypothetical protein
MILSVTTVRLPVVLLLLLWIMLPVGLDIERHSVDC